MSRVYNNLRFKNPVPEFDNRIVFYDYVVVNKITQRVDASIRINHSTGELPASVVLPSHCEVANHRYFIDGIPVRGSVTGLNAKYMTKFDAEFHSTRIASGTKIFEDEAYKYHQQGRAKLEAAWRELRAVNEKKCFLYESVDQHYTEAESPDYADSEAMKRYEAFRAIHDPFVKRVIVEEWEANRDDAAARGTAMHSLIQRYYEEDYDSENGEFDTPEFAQFIKFQKEWVEPRGYKIFRSELSMYDPYSGLCGTIDALYEVRRHPPKDGIVMIDVALADWKRTLSLETAAFNGTDTCKAPFEDWPECKTSERWLQLLTYMRILQINTNYRFRVVAAHIVAFHVDSPTGTFVVMDVPAAEIERSDRLETVFREQHEAKLDALRDEINALTKAGRVFCVEQDYRFQPMRLRKIDLELQRSQQLCRFARLIDVETLVTEMCTGPTGSKKRKETE